MSEITKHVGVITNTGKKCVIVFLQLPERQSHALIVDTDALPDRMHDPLMSVINSKEGQQSNSLADVLGRRLMPDTGKSVLLELHEAGQLQPKEISSISLRPRPNSIVPLADVLKAMGKEVPEADQAVDPTIAAIASTLSESTQAETPVVPAVDPTAGVDPNSDPVMVAKGLLAQAELLEIDLTAMKEKAYALAPSLKPAAKKTARTRTKSEPKTTRAPARSRSRKATSA